MPTKTLPLTTYSVRQNKPNQQFGSPARLPIQDGESQVFARVPLDKVPLGATIDREPAARPRAGGDLDEGLGGQPQGHRHLPAHQRPARADRS